MAVKKGAAGCRKAGTPHSVSWARNLKKFAMDLTIGSRHIIPDAIIGTATGVEASCTVIP